MSPLIRRLGVVAMMLTAGAASAKDSKQNKLTVLPSSGGQLVMSSSDERVTGSYSYLGQRCVVAADIDAPLNKETGEAPLLDSAHQPTAFNAGLFLGVLHGPSHLADFNFATADNLLLTEMFGVDGDYNALLNKLGVGEPDSVWRASSTFEVERAVGRCKGRTKFWVAKAKSDALGKFANFAGNTVGTFEKAFKAKRLDCAEKSRALAFAKLKVEQDTASLQLAIAAGTPSQGRQAALAAAQGQLVGLARAVRVCGDDLAKMEPAAAKLSEASTKAKAEIKACPDKVKALFSARQERNVALRAAELHGRLYALAERSFGIYAAVSFTNMEGVEAGSLYSEAAADDGSPVEDTLPNGSTVPRGMFGEAEKFWNFEGEVGLTFQEYYESYVLTARVGYTGKSERDSTTVDACRSESFADTRLSTKHCEKLRIVEDDELEHGGHVRLAYTRFFSKEVYTPEKPDEVWYTPGLEVRLGLEDLGMDTARWEGRLNAFVSPGYGVARATTGVGVVVGQQFKPKDDDSGFYITPMVFVGGRFAGN